ncbi:ubiquitin carboxyl-terminal hydrolase 8 isoform X2 [Spodoptera litura]|uniref:ubiquitinyl hydrolase 1 n=1 Tax=Spodoptera litura TaxID=69820 RepID=A0A9J7DT48_SPOLT|nr:ubiquitin carboxyl-terminal hydrolase 8 isoform X2 [Spodoptera litura]
MTETRKLQLHLGKCIEDLDKLHNVPDLKSKRANLLCKTALKLFESAEESREKGDEEYSYVYYMKYLRVIAYISKDKDYLKDKTYYNNMLGPKNPNKAIDQAEKLKNSLIDRYQQEQKEKRLNDIKENELIKQNIDENRKKMAEAAPVIEPPQPLGLPGPDEVTIKSEMLYSILKNGRIKVMILDARPGKDYIESHINYPACISVPEECISPGQSANVLEQNLPLASRPVWAERANMELIVMLDWNSTAVIPGKTLHLLKTTLLKWDVKVQYSRPPLALLSGYEDWLLKYPACTTNPQAVPPRQDDFMDDMLGEIEYPNWSDLSPSAAAAPAAPRKPGEPVVDRSSKAAAVQMYSERARNMAQILEQQERIADTSLTLEMQRIEAEQDWEKVREQREAEMQDELRAMYKLREQEIISQLMQLENKQYDMEQENQSLREQLEEYQRKEREEAEKMAETISATSEDTEAADAEASRAVAAAARELAAARARIAAVTLQRRQLDRTREALEHERKRKLQHARHNKPDAHKPSHVRTVLHYTPHNKPDAHKPSHVRTVLHYTPHNKPDAHKPSHVRTVLHYTPHNKPDAHKPSHVRTVLHYTPHNKPDAHKPSHVRTVLHYTPHNKPDAHKPSHVRTVLHYTPHNKPDAHKPSHVRTVLHYTPHNKPDAHKPSHVRTVLHYTPHNKPDAHKPSHVRTVLHYTPHNKPDAHKPSHVRTVLHYTPHNKPDAHKPSHVRTVLHYTPHNKPDAHKPSHVRTVLHYTPHNKPDAHKPSHVSSDEEEPCVPAFDRSTKPTKVAPSSDLHQRDFQPVWGDVGRGLTGLKNLGNTCYMNSIIQCLNNTAILVTYFCNGQYLEHVNRSHSTRGAIAEELAAVVRALWSGQYRFIATRDLRNEVGKHQRAFRGCEQQDSHEFLTILMDWLHLDLQFSINVPQHKDNLPPSEKAWHEYTKSKESLILRLFYGQIKSTVRCTVCGKQSVTYESFSNLSLELPANANRCSLSDCLKLYLNDETIPGWNCPNCKEKRDALKKLDISRLPPVLVIHFKRFYVDPKEYMCNAYRKKQTYIDFPFEELDMRQFAHCTSSHAYNLYAVSNHYGSMEGGHYTAYCKSSVYGKWYKYDDHVVTEIPSSEVKSSAAYILFYSTRAS